MIIIGCEKQKRKSWKNGRFIVKWWRIGKITGNKQFFVSCRWQQLPMPSGNLPVENSRMVKRTLWPPWERQANVYLAKRSATYGSMVSTFIIERKPVISASINVEKILPRKEQIHPLTLQLFHQDLHAFTTWFSFLSNQIKKFQTQ